MCLIFLINNSAQNNNLWVLTDSLQESYLFLNQTLLVALHVCVCVQLTKTRCPFLFIVLYLLATIKGHRFQTQYRGKNIWCGTVDSANSHAENPANADFPAVECVYWSEHTYSLLIFSSSLLDCTPSPRGRSTHLCLRSTPLQSLLPTAFAVFSLLSSPAPAAYGRWPSWTHINTFRMSGGKRV